MGTSYDIFSWKIFDKDKFEKINLVHKISHPTFLAFTIMNVVRNAFKKEVLSQNIKSFLNFF